MDYEKFYDETLRNLQEMVRKGKITEAVAKGICADFVAESEDEKIRKALKEYFINSFQNNGVAAICGVHIKDILAWLEKQKGTEREIEGNSLCNGEQKPVNRLKTTAGNWYVCEMEVANENMTTAFHRGEVYYCPKDGYIDVNGALFEVGTLDVFRLATKEEIPQPKQEWSEEDERLRNSCISHIEEELERIRNDKYGHSEIISDLKESCRERINWLKSLRHQATWKPSDLPHWKKSTLPNDNTTGFNSDYFCYKGYNINYKELFEKLPKDD